MVNPAVQLCALKGPMMNCDVSPWNTVTQHIRYYQQVRSLNLRYTSDSMAGEYYYCYHLETYWKRTAYKASCNSKNIMNTNGKEYYCQKPSIYANPFGLSLIQWSSIPMEGENLSVLRNTISDLTCYNCLNNEAGVISQLRYKFNEPILKWIPYCEIIVENSTCPSQGDPPVRIISQKPSCPVESYYNLKLQQCERCDVKFPGCSLCNSTDCIYCKENLFPNKVGITRYLTSFSTSTSQQCMYDMCDEGFCQEYDLKMCFPMVAKIGQCLRCQSIHLSQGGYDQDCIICKKGYKRETFNNNNTGYCVLIPTTSIQLTYFVNSLVPLYLTRQDSSMQPVTNSVWNETYSYILTSFSLLRQKTNNPQYGLDVKTAFTFIMEAINQVQSQASQGINLTATIYLSRGIHYFFTCNKFDTTSNSQIPLLDPTLKLINYCDMQLFDLYRKDIDTNDNIAITVMPLYCSLHSQLNINLSNKTQFLNQCVKSTADQPVVSVNSPQSYFNITGDMKFVGIKFSGANSLVIQDPKASYYLTHVPISYCSSGSIGSNMDPNFEFQKISNFLRVQYTCDVQNSRPQKNKNTFVQRQFCQANAFAKFSPKKESTYGCGGEIYSPEYHQRSNYLSASDFTSHNKRKTLFNLYSLGLERSNRDLPPSLTIQDCTFENFFGMESLIYIEAYSARIASCDPNSFNSEIESYLAIEGADRGAQIKIQSSTFKDSQFCKGLLVYRQPIFFESNLVVVNMTNKYMQKSEYWRNFNKSFISIQNSYFTNLNALYEVKALAITGNKNLIKLSSLKNKEELLVPQFANKGIVINVEGFNGPIEIDNSVFENNAHYIGAILYRADSNYQLMSLSEFEDTVTTEELKLTVCSGVEDKIIFGISKELTQGSEFDLDTLFDKYERLSTIYVSQPGSRIIIQNSKFYRNLATFGGGITINSPNWSQKFQPQIVLYNNVFMNNFAYFSGNAIYLRPTQIFQKINSQFICGAGITIASNYFKNNIGMKTHNGGAISINCFHIDSFSHPDSNTTSDISIEKTILISDSNFSNLTHIELKSQLTGKIIRIDKHRLKISDNQFQENFSGGKGTAIYINKISLTNIFGNSFYRNGPVYAQTELLYSPYVKQYQGRPATFFHEECFDEFQYLQNCNFENVLRKQTLSQSLNSLGSLQWSKIQGVVFASFCQSDTCKINRVVQDIEIQFNEFIENDAGPIIQGVQTDTASQIYIINARYAKVFHTKFLKNKGNPYQFQDLSNWNSQKGLKDFFPKDFFFSSHSPLITFQVLTTQNTGLNSSLMIDSCTFTGSHNFQTITLPGSSYSGSLIQFINKVQSPILLPGEQTYLDIINSIFSDNIGIGESISLIYTSKVLTRVIGCTFQRNGRISQQAYKSPVNMTTLIGKKVSFSFSDYEVLDTQMYGCIRVSGGLQEMLEVNGPHRIVNNSFTQIYSHMGAAIILQDIIDQQVEISGNTFQKLYTIKGGSILHFKQAELNSIIKYSNNKAQQLYSGENSAIFYSMTPSTSDATSLQIPLSGNNFFLLDSEFRDLSSQTEATALNIQRVNKFLMVNCTFTQTGYLLSNQSLDSVNAVSSIINQMQNSDESVGPGLIKIVESKNSNSRYINLPYIFNGQPLYPPDGSQYFQHAQIINCNFSNIRALESAIMLITDSKVRVSANRTGKSVIQKNHATYNAGVIEVNKNSFLILENIVLSQNSAGLRASTIYLSQSTMNVTGCIFSENQASEGTIVITLEGKMTISNSQFIMNKAEDSSLLISEGNGDVESNILNCTIIKNRHKSNLMSVYKSAINIRDSKFIDNFADSISHGLNLIKATVLFDNIFVNYTDPNFLTNFGYQASIGFVSINFRSIVTITRSQFHNCRGADQAVVICDGRSQVTIGNDTIFKNCQSGSVLGEVIKIKQSSGSQIDSTQIINTSANGISVEESDNFRIHNCSLRDIGLNALKLNSLGQLKSYVTNCSFSSSTSQLSQKSGGGIYSQSHGLVVIQNNSFQGLSGDKGGAIYLTCGQDQILYNVTNNIFYQNSAIQGGSIYFNDGTNLILSNNIFRFNKAVSIPNDVSSLGQGAALFLSCGMKKNCSVDIQDNQFMNNSASHEGGAILWTKNRPNFGSNYLKNNNAIYGQNVGSYPKNVKFNFISNNDLYYNNNSRLLIDKTVGDPVIVSGIQIDFTVEIFDQDGQRYTIDSNSTAILKSESKNVIIKNNEVQAQKGIYNFSKVQITAQPGSSIDLYADFDGIQDYGNSLDFVEQALDIAFTVRKCELGEEMTVDLRCVICGENQYLLNTTDSPLQCMQCPKNGKCYGRNILAPMKGHWRSSQKSTSFLKCPNEEACLEGNQIQSLGNCAKGYQDILCGNCAPFYSKVKQFMCQECPEITRNIVQISFIMIGFFAYVIFMVRSTLVNASQQKSNQSVYMKILTNHIQIITTISSIDYQWPNQIRKFQDQQLQIASTAGSQIFSFDCFMGGKNGIDDGIPVFFEKLIMYGTLPFILVAACFIFWFLVSLLKKIPFREFFGQFVSSLVILLFMFHPNIAQAMFLTFNCLEVEGVYRMKENIASVCYEGDHMKFISIVAFPAIGLWVLGIPLFSWFLLYRNKEILKLLTQKEITEEENQQIINLKTKYGFLFSGYKGDAYFWETIITYRKIAIIMASVFLSTVSPESQVLVVIFIIVISMFLQIRFSPYQVQNLNQMENYSLQVSAVTVYTGMFYITGKNYDYVNNEGISWFFLVCIALPNVVFVLYWAYFMRIELIKKLFFALAEKHPRIFTVLACQTPDSFYRTVIKVQEQQDQETQQIVIKNLQSQTPQDDFSGVIVNNQCAANNKTDETLFSVNETYIDLDDKKWDKRVDKRRQRKLITSKVHPQDEVNSYELPKTARDNHYQGFEISDDLISMQHAYTDRRKKRKKKKKKKVVRNEDMLDELVSIGEINVEDDSLKQYNAQS